MTTTYRERVLLVEDNGEDRRVMSEMVRQFGFDCLEAETRDQALEIIRDRRLDVIIADIHGMDGLELVQEVHEIVDDIPFMVITGFGCTYENVVGAGAHEFIKKPFTAEELRNKLKRIFKERHLALENRRLLDEQIALNRKISSLLDIAMDLTAEHDFDRLFSLIISRVTRAMDAERSSLYLIDWERNLIWTTVAERVGRIHVPLGEGISGRVAQTGETINVPDAWELPYFNREYDLQHAFRTKAVLCMPICNRRGERTSVIQVINRKDGGAFTKQDEDLLRPLASQVAIALENAQLLEEIKLSFESSIRTLSATVDAKHHLTAGHSERVTEYALLIAMRLGMTDQDLEIIRFAGLLHDIGKVGIRDDVLLKYGPFTPEERAEMETHTVKTLRILEKFHFGKPMEQVPYIAAHHHERYDGKGYPDGLAGEEIPLGARILAVADVFDALTSHRDYPKYTQNEIFNHAPMPLDKVIRILREGAGTQFDGRVVDAFMAVMAKALHRYRGTHFPPDYVDETIASLRQPLN